MVNNGVTSRIGDTIPHYEIGTVELRPGQVQVGSKRRVFADFRESFRQYGND
ncbi:hypothetical protein GJ744_011107 [Endocarpon pusillum]|uniref:Uncharacterized protein n=1 Tax=Endocarpon pusillum TaxID=364733 RepID=A0A8H7AH51_9EURO|nr:hypothetical protein GJ744_011107 [Endocarpon pusillum]